jgi:hypothetical protein
MLGGMLKVLLFWLPVDVRAAGNEPLPLRRGDRLTIHHPLPLLDRIALKMRGIELEIS